MQDYSYQDLSVFPEGLEPTQSTASTWRWSSDTEPESYNFSNSYSNDPIDLDGLFAKLPKEATADFAGAIIINAKSVTVAESTDWESIQGGDGQDTKVTVPEEHFSGDDLKTHFQKKYTNIDLSQALFTEEDVLKKLEEQKDAKLSAKDEIYTLRLLDSLLKNGISDKNVKRFNSSFKDLHEKCLGVDISDANSLSAKYPDGLQRSVQDTVQMYAIKLHEDTRIGELKKQAELEKKEAVKQALAEQEIAHKGALATITTEHERAIGGIRDVLTKAHQKSLALAGKETGSALQERQNGFDKILQTAMRQERAREDGVSTVKLAEQKAALLAEQKKSEDVLRNQLEKNAEDRHAELEAGHKQEIKRLKATVNQKVRLVVSQQAEVLTTKIEALEVEVAATIVGAKNALKECGLEQYINAGYLEKQINRAKENAPSSSVDGKATKGENRTAQTTTLEKCA